MAAVSVEAGSRCRWGRAGRRGARGADARGEEAGRGQEACEGARAEAWEGRRAASRPSESAPRVGSRRRSGAEAEDHQRDPNGARPGPSPGRRDVLDGCARLPRRPRGARGRTPRTNMRTRTRPRARSARATGGRSGPRGARASSTDDVGAAYVCCITGIDVDRTNVLSLACPPPAATAAPPSFPTLSHRVVPCPCRPMPSSTRTRTSPSSTAPSPPADLVANGPWSWGFGPRRHGPRGLLGSSASRWRRRRRVHPVIGVEVELVDRLVLDLRESSCPGALSAGVQRSGALDGGRRAGG